MLILGHVGITFGVALATEAAVTPHPAHGAGAVQRWISRWRAAMDSLARRVDLRVLVTGSLLPDLIDKPVGLILFPNVFGTGRLFSHSLVFTVVLALGGLLLYRTKKRSGLLVLAYGSAMHLLLDAMWRTPSLLFWPLAGPLPRGMAPEDWFARWAQALLTNPAAYVPEIVGAILLLPLAWVILRHRGAGRFLRSGVMS